jgi:hypothetical protein
MDGDQLRQQIKQIVQSLDNTSRPLSLYIESFHREQPGDVVSQYAKRLMCSRKQFSDALLDVIAEHEGISTDEVIKKATDRIMLNRVKSKEDDVICPDCGAVGELLIDGLAYHVFVEEFGPPITNGLGICTDVEIDHPAPRGRHLLRPSSWVKAVSQLDAGALPTQS